MTLQEFLDRTNGRCKTRLFDENDYKSFVAAEEEARLCAKKRQPFYCEHNAGRIPYCLLYSPSTTARWGVWVEPRTLEVEIIADRCIVRSRKVRCVRYGGFPRYNKDWQDWIKELSNECKR